VRRECEIREVEPREVRDPGSLSTVKDALFCLKNHTDFTTIHVESSVFSRLPAV